MNKSILLLLGFAFLFGACKKDDDASNTEKLTTGQWKLTASVGKFTFNGVLQTVDVYANLGACQKDNIVEFKTDGTTISDEGPSKCASGDPQQTTGTWAFAQDETHLIVNGGGYNFDAEIIEFTDTKLKVKYETNNGGIVTTYDTTFEKI